MQKVPLLDRKQCVDMTKRVKALRKYWINRRTFYTLGAATYQDEPYAYPAIANAFNTVLYTAFPNLLQELRQVIPGIGLKSYMPGTAVPGFHIVDNRANGVQGSIHIDEPYERIDWGQKTSGPLSFTMAVAIPECGAGLNIWPDLTDDDISAYEVDHAVPEPEYIPYELGMLYIHDGKTPHQMANPGNLKTDELRITLQGHAITLPLSNVTALYF